MCLITLQFAYYVVCRALVVQQKVPLSAQFSAQEESGVQFSAQRSDFWIFSAQFSAQLLALSVQFSAHICRALRFYFLVLTVLEWKYQKQIQIFDNLRVRLSWNTQLLGLKSRNLLILRKKWPKNWGIFMSELNAALSLALSKKCRSALNSALNSEKRPRSIQRSAKGERRSERALSWAALTNAL